MRDIESLSTRPKKDSKKDLSEIEKLISETLSHFLFSWIIPVVCYCYAAPNRQCMRDFSYGQSCVVENHSLHKVR